MLYNALHPTMLETILNTLLICVIICISTCNKYFFMDALMEVLLY